MLHLRAVSGAELATLPVEESSDVGVLKRNLQKLRGFPPRFRQRILHKGACLQDDAVLTAGMDLQLVLLTFADASESQKDQLLQAALLPDLAQLERLLQAPLDPNLENTNVGTNLILNRPLLASSQSGHVEAMRLLLDARADANIAGNHGFTALILASVGGFPAGVRLLLEARADTSLSDSNFLGIRGNILKFLGPLIPKS